MTSANHLPTDGALPISGVSRSKQPTLLRPRLPRDAIRTSGIKAEKKAFAT